MADEYVPSEDFEKERLVTGIARAGADSARSDLDCALLVAAYLGEHTELPIRGEFIAAGMTMLAGRSTTVERGESLIMQMAEHGYIDRE